MEGNGKRGERICLLPGRRAGWEGMCNAHIFLPEVDKKRDFALSHVTSLDPPLDPPLGEDEVKPALSWFLSVFMSASTRISPGL